MSFDQIYVLVVLLGALTLFATERIPLGVTGLGVIAALGLAGVLDANRALSAFASPTLVIVGSLYVVSAGLLRTGVVARLGERLLRRCEGSEARLLLTAMLAAMVLSTLLNNTSVVVLMLPLLLGAAKNLGISPSRLLMPVSFAAILGGTMTLIGTSTNVLVADLARTQQPSMEPLGFFEFTTVGAGYAVLGMVYLWLIGRRFLPSRPTVSSITQGKTYEYVTELRVPATGPAVGLTREAILRHAGNDVRLLQHIRDEEILEPDEEEPPLAAGDLLVLKGPASDIVALRRDLLLEAASAGGEEAEPLPRGTTFAEIVITPGSELQGRTIKSLRPKKTLGVLAIALQRRQSHLRHGIAEIPLHVGDLILVQGTPDDVERLRDQAGLLLLTGVEERTVHRRRAPVAVGILLVFVLMAALSGLNLSLLALAAAVAALATGCISLRAAVRAVDWNTLGLLAGSIALGYALHETRLAAEVADTLINATDDYGHVAVLSAIYFLTMLTTEFVSNSGAAALMLPVALSTANELDVSARPLVFAVAFGASASFSTPIGYQTNAFIFGPGGYRFSDFAKVGLPLQLLLWGYATLVLPLAFPF